MSGWAVWGCIDLWSQDFGLPPWPRGTGRSYRLGLLEPSWWPADTNTDTLTVEYKHSKAVKCLKGRATTDGYFDDVDSDQNFDGWVFGDSVGDLTCGVFFILWINGINQEGALRTENGKLWKLPRRQRDGRTLQAKLLYLVFSHQPLFIVIILIFGAGSAFVERKRLQPVLKLVELWLQVTFIQLNTSLLVSITDKLWIPKHH